MVLPPAPAPARPVHSSIGPVDLNSRVFQQAIFLYYRGSRTGLCGLSLAPEALRAGGTQAPACDLFPSDREQLKAEGRDPGRFVKPYINGLEMTY